MKILMLDLETSPMTAHTWGLWKQDISLKQILASTEVLCFGARWYGKKQVIFKSVHHHGKQAMLEEIHRLMGEADAVVGWNSAAFDIKHLKREFLEAGMLPPSPAKDIDLMKVVKSQFRFPSNKLDYVAQRLGVGSKVQHSGFDLWIRCMAGENKAWAEMKKYQIQDVDLLIDIYEKLLPWIPSHPSVGLYEGIDNVCVNCGSPNMVSSGIYVGTTGSYDRFQCEDCGKWMKASRSIMTGKTSGI
jgi:hypothetical protein